MVTCKSIMNSVLCRYSAEKRYYPYGKDEEGIAQSIREGLLNPNRSSNKPGRGSKQVCVNRFNMPLM